MTVMVSAVSPAGIAVDSGFDVHADRRLGSSRHAPATDWNGKFENEWVLEYTRYAFHVHFGLIISSFAATSELQYAFNAHTS